MNVKDLGSLGNTFKPSWYVDLYKHDLIYRGSVYTEVSLPIAVVVVSGVWLMENQALEGYMCEC